MPNGKKFGIQNLMIEQIEIIAKEIKYVLDWLDMIKFL
jgi:hypothetical protein